MNELLVKILGSAIRYLLVLLGAYFVEQGWWSQDQSTANIEQLFGGVMTLAVPLVWAVWKHYTDTIKLKTALQSPAGLTLSDIKWKIKLGQGATLKTILVLAMVGLTASLASAQTSLVDQGVSMARQLAVTSGTPAQAAPQTVTVQVPEKTWLRMIQGVYVTAMVSDGWAACNAVRQKDVKGDPINTPSNALVPDSCSTIIAEKVGVATAALVASEKLYDGDHKWEAYATLAGTAVGFIASVMTTVYEKPDTGIFPVPKAASAKRIALRFTIRP